MIPYGPASLPPLYHRATLKRNAVAGLSPSNSPLPPDFDVVDPALPCTYWEPERGSDRAPAGLREGPNVVAVLLGPRLLVARDADVQVDDQIAEIRDPSGSVVTGQKMRVMNILWRRSHQEVALELVSAGAVQETGS